jgi:hypothetical protein
MSWDRQKYVLLFAGVLLLLILAFLLGITYGVSSDRNQFINTLIPVFSAVGSWVSGIGALGAVFVALWLAEKKNKANREHLNLEFNCVLTSLHKDGLLCIEAVSVGQKPSNISSLYLVGGKGCTKKIAWTEFAQGSTALPSKLSYGEKAYYFLLPGSEKQIGEYIKVHCDGRAKELNILVNTTTETFSLKPNKGMQAMLESHAK